MKSLIIGTEINKLREEVIQEAIKEYEFSNNTDDSFLVMERDKVTPYLINKSDIVCMYQFSRNMIQNQLLAGYPTLQIKEVIKLSDLKLSQPRVINAFLSSFLQYNYWHKVESLEKAPTMPAILFTCNEFLSVLSRLTYITIHLSRIFSLPIPKWTSDEVYIMTGLEGELDRIEENDDVAKRLNLNVRLSDFLR